MTDLEAAARELYALAPEEFVAARTRLVREARATKDRALATEIGALRKPTRTAWLVNALARDDPDAVDALIGLGDELRTAQEARDGAALRALSARRRTAIDALVRRAAALGEEAGQPPTEATTNEVAQTLQAALGDPGVATQVREGRLAGAAVYGGFGGPSEDAAGTSDGGDLAALLAASMPGAKGGGKGGAEQERDDAEEQARREAEERRAALEQARDEARTALDDAQDAADRATEAADAAAEELDRLRDALSRAEDAEREARAAARAARDEVRARRAEADEAERALRDAE
ncbi:hypothetical protein SAMN04488544_3237 [Microlunatus sagamiharensis]|uniref:Uncharacterized protein n=1 Tax=Microlunatus sagamiharensis TaxID=546874 RepID=A0A1H2N3K6_9ACTN|nr:hypothetical protein [Microlunatus sagamiharensis]SDU99934.1 hypothetical protein SAMN04488544_3237 [Microlunatus sagamiharensis]